MRTRYFALAAGVVYLLVGVAGFVPGLVDDRSFGDLSVDSGSGELFGLFPINVLHNIVHLVIGAAGILAYRSFDAARTYSRALAVVYALLAVMGLLDAADINKTFGLIPIQSHDVWLHAATAAVAAYFGFGPVEAGETYHDAGARDVASRTTS